METLAQAPLPLRLKLLRLVGKQTWIPRGQDRILRAIWHPDCGVNFPFTVDFFGFRYPGDLAEFIDWTVFAYGSYAHNELMLLAALTAELRKRKSRVVFFDIGANVGQHSLFMAGKVDDVFSFEPFPPLQEKIRLKVELNNIRNVQVIPFALGDADGALKYHPGAGQNAGTGTFIPEENGIYAETVGLPIRRGDHLSSELDLPPVDIMKIDVEGLEPGVLRGFRERIQRDRPVVLMELSDRSRSGFGSEQGLRDCFWDGAVFAGVSGRGGKGFRLSTFRYAEDEILVVPPELADFVGRYTRKKNWRPRRN